MNIEFKTHEGRAKFYRSGEWHRLRDAVLQRDNYECQECKRNGKLTTRHDDILEVDHIKTVEEHPELATDMNNMQVLCKSCHNKKHGRFQFKQSTNKWRSDERW